MQNRRHLATSALVGLTTGFLGLTSACSFKRAATDHDSGALDVSSDLPTGADQDSGPPDTAPDHGTSDGLPDVAAPDMSRESNVTGPIWSDQSRAIDIRCVGYIEGSKGIRATREQLSNAQLAMLSGLTLVPPKECVTDLILCQVQITAADGTVAKYEAEESDVGCAATGPIISYQALDAFMQSLPCSFGARVTVTADGGQNPPSLIPDARCFNGVFADPPQTTRLLLQVDDASIPRHFELDSCNGSGRSPTQVHPQLMSPDGQTLLSAGTTVTEPGPDQTCWRLDYTFAAAGKYPLNIGLDQGFPASDLYLRFY